jgi:hypothetical protein
MAQFTNRLVKLELWRDKYVPPVAEPTVADVVGQLREAFAYTLTRASMDKRWGSDDWLALSDAARHVAPRHPALPPRDDELTDAGFIKLFRDWLTYRDAGDGDPPFGFPSAEVWDRYSGEVWQAWQEGTSPAAWKARRPTSVSVDTPIVATTNGQADG